jgi:hypothetical protein
MRRTSTLQVEGAENKTKGNEGEGALLVTDLRSDIYAVSIGVRKCENPLDCCNALDSKREGETNAARLLVKV